VIDEGQQGKSYGKMLMRLRGTFLRRGGLLENYVAQQQHPL